MKTIFALSLLLAPTTAVARDHSPVASLAMVTLLVIGAVLWIVGTVIFKGISGKKSAENTTADYTAFKKEVYVLLKKDYPNDGDRLPAAAKKLVDSIILNDFQNNISRNPEATWMKASLALMANGICLS